MVQHSRPHHILLTPRNNLLRHRFAPHVKMWRAAVGIKSRLIRVKFEETEMKLIINIL